jgi:hypothetical protein
MRVRTEEVYRAVRMKQIGTDAIGCKICRIG